MFKTIFTAYYIFTFAGAGGDIVTEERTISKDYISLEECVADGYRAEMRVKASIKEAEATKGHPLQSIELKWNCYTAPVGEPA